MSEKEKENEIARLRSFIAESLPFLREAWEVCFQGQKEALLSAEERGMGRLLASFQAVADGQPKLPPGVITLEESEQRVQDAIGWAHRLLGQPNKLKKELRTWVHLGETCADGLVRANDEVVSLRGQLDKIQQLAREWTS